MSETRKKSKPSSTVNQQIINLSLNAKIQLNDEAEQLVDDISFISKTLIKNSNAEEVKIFPSIFKFILQIIKIQAIEIIQNS